MRFLTWLKSGTPLAVLLKVVGTASALISLFLGIVQVKNVVTKWRSGQAATRELLAAADFKLSTRDYAQAWALATQAVDSFPSSDSARAKQLSVAMAWLRDIRLGAPGDPSFSAVADKLTPVLLRAASRARGRTRADALAHLGWLTFLKWRDGSRGLAVAEPYRQALAIDPVNLYANAMLAHWLLYPGGGGGTLESARPHFARALGSATTADERQFVRYWQATALINRNEEFAPELIRLSAAMAAQGDTLSAGDRSRILWLAYTLPGWTGLDHLTDSVSVTEQQAAFPWLVRGLDAERNPLYRAVTARLTELAGDTAQAVASYQAILKEFPTLPPGGKTYLAGAVKSRQRYAQRP